MVIGIDASRAVKQTRSGPENYSWEIIQYILKAGGSQDFFRLYAPHLPKEAFFTNKNTEWRIIPPRRLWSQLGLAKELKSHPPDVLFVPSHVIPFLSNLPSVVTIHDVAYRFFPESYSRPQRNYLEFTTGVSVKKARAVVVPSLCTAEDLAKIYPAEKKKIVVIPHGFNRDAFKPASENNRPLAEPYIMYFGRIEEKKNTKFLVEAFALLCKEQTPAKLVLAGSSEGYGYDKVQEAIKALPKAVQDRIVQPSYLPEPELIRYLQHASVFAFPSRYEGFGLSAINAMACGAPVVCSDTPALAEVVGEAGVVLKATNPLSWAAAFSRILNQPKLAEELKRKGIKRAGQFSWERAADQTLEVIRNVAGAR